MNILVYDDAAFEPGYEPYQPVTRDEETHEITSYPSGHGDFDHLTQATLDEISQARLQGELD